MTSLKFFIITFERYLLDPLIVRALMYIYIYIYIYIFFFFFFKRETLTYFKESAFMIMEYGKSKICSVGQQAGDPRRISCCSSGLKAVRLENFLLLRGGLSLVLVRLTADWMRPAHIMEGDLLYPKSTNLSESHPKTSSQKHSE